MSTATSTAAEWFAIHTRSRHEKTIVVEVSEFDIELMERQR